MKHDDVIAFLSNGASYGLPDHPVDRIETHCSVVFLAGDRAYKLKRPIAFSALDYTSLEKRETACRREVELNRRTAPELYLDVQAIHCGNDGRLEFDGPGPIVDWVVVMRRFDQSDLFDRLADASRLTPGLMSALADEIARFHAVAEVTGAHGGTAGLRQAIEHNHRDQGTVASILGTETIERLYVTSNAALERLAPLLERRRAAGKVRLCHGDLRLANICLYHGRPTLFDGIEFAAEISCVDVLYDLAFLLMDLAHRGHDDLANLVFNRYLDQTGDHDGLAALPLMLSIRAGTRAYAVAASAMRKSDALESARLAAAAASLMRRAASLLEPASPRLIVIGGRTESARDTIADDLAPRLAPAPGARMVRRRPQATAHAMISEAAAVITAGYTVIMDAQLGDALAGSAEMKEVHVVRLWVGDARTAPPNWHILDRERDPAAAMAAARRLTGAAAAQRG